MYLARVPSFKVLGFGKHSADVAGTCKKKAGGGPGHAPACHDDVLAFSHEAGSDLLAWTGVLERLLPL